MSQKAKRRYDKRMKAKRKAENQAAKNKPKAYAGSTPVETPEAVIDEKPAKKPKRLEKKEPKKKSFIQRISEMTIAEKVFWFVVIIAALDLIGLVLLIGFDGKPEVTSNSLFMIIAIIPYAVSYMVHCGSLIVGVFMVWYCLYMNGKFKSKYWFYALALILGVIAVNDIATIINGLSDDVAFKDCLKIMFSNKFIYGWFITMK